MFPQAALIVSLLAPLLPQPGSPQASGDSSPRSSTLDAAHLAQLLTIKRLYVDRLTGGETAAQIRDMIIASLQGAGLFVLTENPDRADAVLRGSAEDLIFTDTFSSSEGINARGAISASSPQSHSSPSRRSAYLSAGVGDQESVRIAERKHEACAAVRLVNKDGDVIWSTTQESLGGKFRGASADVADKITRQLVADFDRARKLLPR